MTNKTKRKADERSWRALLFCALLPATIGVAMAAGTTLAGCKRRPETPARWIGIDRSKVSCAWDGDPYREEQATCVGDGRAYKCVREESTWRCAELVTRPQAAERPVAGGVP